MSTGISRLETRYFLVVYDKRTKRSETEVSGLFRRDGETVTVISAEPLAQDFPESVPGRELALRCKGIVIERNLEGSTLVYNDPFCTIPVYFREERDQIVVTSSPQRVVSYQGAPLDPVGFWETVIFGTGVWTRTPFQGLRSLPSACRLALDKEAEVTRYWNFGGGPSGEKDERGAVEGLDALLSRKFERFGGQKVVLGLSGGMDSRLAALYLHNVVPPENVRLFTFAVSSASNEFRYAKEVAKALGWFPPELFLLKDVHYREGLEYLPYWTAGQIGNNHCHIAQYLRRAAPGFGPDPVHLSTYYTDALLGWECNGELGDLGVESAAIYRKALTHPWLSEQIREEILADISLSLKDASGSSGFSSAVEFGYVTERHPRFHLALAFAQSQFMGTVTPFADFELLEFIRAVPLGLRRRKRIIDALIAYRRPKLLEIGNSSSREYFYGSNNLMLKRGWGGKLNYFRFRLLNALNDCSVLLTGKCVVENPFQTEEPVAVYRRRYARLLKEVVQSGPISELLLGGRVENDELTAPKLREKNIAEKYQLVNLAQILAHP